MIRKGNWVSHVSSAAILAQGASRFTYFWRSWEVPYNARRENKFCHGTQGVVKKLQTEACTLCIWSCPLESCLDEREQTSIIPTQYLVQVVQGLRSRSLDVEIIEDFEDPFALGRH